MHISIIAVERSCGLKVFHLWLLSYLVQFFFMIPDIFFIFWYWSLHMQIVSWSTQDFTPRNHFATATWSTTEKRIKRLNFPANSYLFCKQNNAFPLLILNAIFSFVSWENLEFLFKFSRAFVDLNQLSINTLSSFFKILFDNTQCSCNFGIFVGKILWRSGNFKNVVEIFSEMMKRLFTFLLCNNNKSA